MAKRLVRSKLDVSKRASVVHVAPGDTWTVNLGDAGNVELFHCRRIDLGERVVAELSVYLRKYSKPRGSLDVINQYLTYVASMDGSLGVQSLKSYKELLDRDPSKSLSTKYQAYNAARAFVRHFMVANHIPEAKLPKGFRTPPKQPKSSFYDIARGGVDVDSLGLREAVDRACSELGLEESEAKALVFCRYSLEAIHEYSLRSIASWGDDWEYVSQVSSDLTQAERQSFSKIESYMADHGDRSVKVALQILHCKFGRGIPASRHWPSGVSDYLKSKGWTTRRVQASFFPTSNIVGLYLSAILSHPILNPNVDSAAFYLYLDSVRPSFDKGFYNVFLGKKRGSASDALIHKSDPLLAALLTLVERIKEYLPYVSGGRELLNQEHVPMLVHFSPSAGRECCVRTLDVSSTSYVVRRVVMQAAKEHLILEPLKGKVSGENFRPTHALIKVLSGKSEYEIKEELHHSHLSTTASYTHGVESNALLMDKYADFQRYLVDGSKDLERTGSGYLCSGEKSSPCGKLHDCFECDAKRIVLKSSDLVAEWLAWSKEIENNRQRLEFANPARWEKYWAVKLAEYQALLANVDAQTIAKAKPLASSLVLPPLD